MIKQRLLLPLVFVLVVQAACSPVAPAAGGFPPPTTISPATALHTAVASPTSITEENLLMNAEDGYSLSYPAEFIQKGRFIILNPVQGPGDVPGEAWAGIYVESAEGRTAAQVADSKISAFGLEDFEIRRTEMRVDGEPAVVVDGLPGPDPVRNVFIVHGDRLYTLIFMPWAIGNSGQPTALESLYDSIMRSLRFTPPTQPLPTPTVPWGPGNLPPPITFEYPLDGQVIDYNSYYSFKVTDIGADGYFWTFSQNGEVVWDSLRDDKGGTAGGGYLISEESEAHSRFVPGPVEVSVRALKGSYLADPTVITIILQ